MSNQLPRTNNAENAENLTGHITTPLDDEIKRGRLLVLWKDHKPVMLTDDAPSNGCD